MTSAGVQLYRTCLIDSFYRNVEKAVVATLEAAGLKVSVPKGQTCCGQPAYNAGFWKEAGEMAKYTIQTLESAPGPVIVPSGSCTHMIRHGYLRIFREDPQWLPRAEQLAARTYEWSEFLVHVIGVMGFRSAFPGKVAYHPSCHLLRGLGITDAPSKLLYNSFHASQIQILTEDCCGFGGIFAVEHAKLSTAMLDQKLEPILSSGVDIITGCDVSCLMQMEGRLRRIGSSIRCAHIAELLID